MKRILFLVYGVVPYVLFLLVFLYLIGFLGNFIVPKTVNSGVPIGTGAALLTNLALIALFGLQHSIMARPSFKLKWTKIVPKPIERSTYVLLSDLLFVVLFWKWQPMPEVIWNLEGTLAGNVLWVLFFSGWGLVVLSSLFINHFDLFGLRQVYLYFKGQEYTPLPFKVTGLYKVIRHPIMLGWIIGFWCTPFMTLGHLVFALGNTVYIFIALYFEERNLVQFFGDRYRDYRKNVPGIIPFLKR